MSWNSQNYNNQGYGYPPQQIPGHGNNGYYNGNSPTRPPVYGSHGPDSRSSPPQFGFAILGSGTSNPKVVPVIFGNHGHTGHQGNHGHSHGGNHGHSHGGNHGHSHGGNHGVRFCGYCGARKPQNYCTNCGN